MFGNRGDWDRLFAHPSGGQMKKILCFTLLFLGVAILLSIGFSVDSSRAADSSDITIAYSSNMMGYLEPCG